MAWRWKKRTPAIPSGARMMEQGRPRMCSIIREPTRSKYLARSSLVTAPWPSSGQSSLSARLRGTPMITAAEESRGMLLNDGLLGSAVSRLAHISRAASGPSNFPGFSNPRNGKCPTPLKFRSSKTGVTSISLATPLDTLDAFCANAVAENRGVRLNGRPDFSRGLLPLSPQSIVVLLNQGLARRFDCFGLRFPKCLICRLGKFSRCTLRSKGFHLTPAA